jgi:uncharacterized protein (DUF433 family)
MTVTSTSDALLATPLYTLTEAADIVDINRATFRSWARGYSYKGTDGHTHSSDVLVTTTGPGRGPVVPFVGLGEAYVLSAFRAAGVPMQRIRPALSRLEQEFGLRAALISDRLRTDGAEVLYEYRDEDNTGAVVESLVVVRQGQAVFREVVRQYLQAISYRDGRIALIRLPQFKPDIIADPSINFGQPTFAARGIRVRDAISRLRAGESARSVAADYGLSLADIQSLAA